MPFGLALAGGGTRGAAHVGVLLALEEEGLIPVSIAGASAGGLVAGLYAAGLNAKALKEQILWMQAHSRRLVDPDYIGLLAAVPRLLVRQPTLSGIIKGNQLQKYLAGLIGGVDIKDIQTKLVIPAVDLTTGATVAFTSAPESATSRTGVTWCGSGNLSDILRATSAVPGVFQPKIIGDWTLIDGGTTDNLPVDLLVAAGESCVLSVDVGADYTAPHKVELIEVMAHAFTLMGARLKQYTMHRQKLLLKPALPAKAGLLTFDQMEACMDAGYQCAKEQMDIIRALCS